MDLVNATGNMKYLFSNKKILLNQIVIVLFTKDQSENLKLKKYFPELNFTSLNRLGLRVTKTYNNRVCGYMVHKINIDGKESLAPYYRNNKKIFLTISSSQCLGLMKY